MDLSYLGCKTAKLNQFAKKNIFSVEDLLKWIPRKYLDFRFPKNVRETQDGEICAVVVTVSKCDIRGGSGTTVLSVKGRDGLGDTLYVSFFNQEYLANQIYVGREMIFCGKIAKKDFNGKLLTTMPNPVLFSYDIAECKTIVPIYGKIAGMSDSYLKETIKKALALIEDKDYLLDDIKMKYGLIGYREALQKVHFPKTQEDIDKAKMRYLYDDLFYFNFALKEKSLQQSLTTSYRFCRFPTVRKYIELLPFELTDGQREVLRNLSTLARDGKRINALVQGDVGTGKTEVAKMMMLSAYDSGTQSVLMAPTNVLARQHYEDLVKSFEPLGVKVGFLSGELKKSERTKLLKQIENQEIDMVVGTHAVISKDVKYKTLSLTIADEEHRFGVRQREALANKAKEGIHSISMSATPIPRSLAISLYGDDISIETITTLPKGRKPIVTKNINDNEALHRGMKMELEKGRQIYIVCPLIEETDSEKMVGVKSVEEVYKEECDYFADTNFKVAMINGKMKQEEIGEIISKFARNEVQILVSTTIIEVGVNVPNASVICIKSCDRFGLAQLHQLRGRVGRGGLQGYCILQNDLDTENSKKKIEIMCKTTDGFIIAKEDLALRGTGDFIGTAQSGDNKYVMLMLANEELNSQIKKDVANIFENSNMLLHYKEALSERNVGEE